MGGLARRATKIVEARTDADATLIFDAGDAFNGGALSGVPVPATGGPSASEVERRARLLATAMARAGITAFTPGEHDLAIGPALFRRIMGDAKIPVVSANLTDPQGARLFEPDRLVDAAGLKVGVFGVTRALPEHTADWQRWGLGARDPVAAARDEVASLRARGANLVVALLHVGNLRDARDLLTKVPGIDWAVLGHSGAMLETPEEVGGARALEAMTQGKNLGRLDLHVVGDGRGRLSFADVGQRAQVAAIRADQQRQVTDYQKRLGDTPAPQPALKTYYENRIRELGAAIERETALLAQLPTKIEGDWFENRILPLNALVADQPGVAMLVAAYNRENARRAGAGLPVGIGTPSHPPAPAPAAAAAPLAYAGTAACGRCHKEALAVWQATKHARAMEALTKVKRDHDPTCVGCHVTGYLRPGGTTDIAVATTRFREVGCEACHGPGLTHATAPSAPHTAGTPAELSRQVPAAVCLGCHTPDQTNGDFDYATFVKAVLGPGHGRGG